MSRASYLAGLQGDAHRAELIRLLCSSKGNVTGAARLAGVTRRIFFEHLEHAGLNDEPAKMRERLRARFTLPPLSYWDEKVTDG